jgi:hypothetical protein
VVTRILLLCLCASGCSLAFPLSEYDEGNASSATTGGAASGGDGGSDGGAGGQGGGAEGGGGQGGVGLAECGVFSNSGTSDVEFDFEGTLPSSLVPHGSCISYEGGEVVFAPASVGDYCWLELAGSRHLTCDSFTVRLSESGSQALGMQRFIYIRAVDGSGELNLLQESGGFNLDLIGSGGPFDPTKDFWWRLRATDRLLVFETSEDGITWNERVSGAPPFSLDEVTIQFGAGMWQDVGTPGQAQYDCLNLAGSCP